VPSPGLPGHFKLTGEKTMKPKTDKNQILKPTEPNNDVGKTFMSKEPDTDLSKPFEIYDEVAFATAVHTIMNILIYHVLDAVEPVVTKAAQENQDKRDGEIS
jgi:hypothetical protein